MNLLLRAIVDTHQALCCFQCIFWVLWDLMLKMLKLNAATSVFISTRPGKMYNQHLFVMLTPNERDIGATVELAVPD